MSKINVTGTNVTDVIADLLVNYSSETAYERLVEDARYARQTVEETARRRASNLLNSFVTRKPGGFVDTL
jgi:hypothetical protein